MVPSYFQCHGTLLIWAIIGQGSAVLLTAGVECVGCFFFVTWHLSCHLSISLLSLCVKLGKIIQCVTEFVHMLPVDPYDQYFRVQWFWVKFFFFLILFSFIGKVWFRRVTLSCDSSYYKQCPRLLRILDHSPTDPHMYRCNWWSK